ncbi:Heat-labile A chain, partial [Cordyceps militaris]
SFPASPSKQAMRIFTTRQSRVSWLSLTVLAAFFLFIGLSHGHPSSGNNLRQLSYRGNSDSKPGKPGKTPKPPKGSKPPVGGGEPSAPPPANAPSSSKGKKVGFKKNIDRLPKFELPEEPLVTYRGETRDAAAIEAAEGFFPRAPTRAITAAETEAGSSIYSHVAVKVAKEYTKYVSTSMDPAAASDFGRSTGFVYVVAPDEKMINVPKTLGEYLSVDFAKESELAAAGQIPFDQIRGWIKKSTDLRPGDWRTLREHGHKLNGKPLTEELKKDLGRALSEAYVPNPKYNAAKYDKTRASGGRPELAGFPQDSPAWQKAPWKQYKGKKTSESLQAFVSEGVCAKAEACVKAQLTSKAGEAGVPNPYEDLDPLCKETDLRKRDVACRLEADEEDPAEAGQTEGETVATEPEGIKEPGSAEEGLGGGSTETAVEKVAQKTSDEVFEDLFTSRKLSQKAAEWGLKIQDARTRVLGYKPLTPQSPHFSISKVGLALEGAGLVAWGAGVVTAFATNTTGWERAAAVTGIVPFVGCGFNIIAESQSKAGIDPIDQMMCITADILLLTPLAPFAFAVQVFRVAAGLLKADAVPKPEEAQATRDAAWSKVLDDTVYTYYYSADKLASNRQFRDKLNGTLYAESMAVVSDAADLIAAANATVQASAAKGGDQAQIRAVVLNVTDQIKAQISPKIVAKQREFLLQLPELIKKGTDLSVNKMAEQYNSETVTNLLSPEVVHHYTPLVPAVPGDAASDLEPSVRRELGVVVEHLKKTPLPLPKLFDVAYVLGQSKGLLDIDPLTLNPGAFIKSRVPTMSQDDVDFHALHHALQISSLLRGATTEEKLSKLWPAAPAGGADGAKTVQELQLLLALKFGRVFDAQKVAASAQLAGKEQDDRFMTHPSIPPLKIAPESMAYIGLILELDEARINAIPRHKEIVGFNELGTDKKLILAMLEKAQGIYAARHNETTAAPVKPEGQAAAAA